MALVPSGKPMLPAPRSPQNIDQHLSQSSPKHFAGAAPLTVLALSCALSACSSLPQSGFSFATRGEQIGDQRSPRGQATAVQTKTQARFAKGQVTLVAPQGHCIDATMLRQEATGGFALLPRCNLLHGTQLFGRNRAAVITATIGPAQGADAPSTTELAQTAEGARLLYYDDKGLLPLVRLQWPGHSAMGGSGASEEHWRGAFVVNNHLVVLALYAPEGSNLLGPAGAKLLTDMTRRSQKASLQAAPQPAAISAREDNVRRPAQHAASPTTRPKARPGSQAGASDPALSPAGTQKLSLGRRIGGLFRTSPEARLTTE
ncbi:hypothetical protein [Pseudophaeobacter sp.]|uniref:hypothetical protein n=1 Tax=Pseudophaeobacter sp. TaxID=1971739 RepID=UPI0032999E75